MNSKIILDDFDENNKKLTITVSFKNNDIDKALYSFILRNSIEFGGKSAYVKHILKKEYNKNI